MPIEVAQGRAISYQRVSTQGQTADEKSGFPRQQAAFDDWCVRHPEHPPLQTYRIARSGAEAGRFQWLYEGLERGDFLFGDVLVVESLSRFGREAMQDSLQNLFDIWKAGIKTAFCDYNDGHIFTTAEFNKEQATVFLLAAKIAAAREEHNEKKTRSKGAITKNHEAIYAGRLNDSHFKERSLREDGKPKRVHYKFWLDFKRVLNNGNGGSELNDRAKWIQRMFELALSIGQDLIADKLYEEGFRSEEGKYLNGKAIGSYLSDRAVLGEWFPTTIEKDPVTGARKKKQVGLVKPDLFPPAVSEELFNRVQEARFKRRTNETYNNGGGSLKHLFGGACYCDECGGLVDRFTQKGGYKPMLRCRNRQCSAKKGIHYNEAELLGQLQGFRWNQFFRDDRKAELLSQINQQMLAEQDELNKEKAKLMNLQASQAQIALQGREWPEHLDALLKEQMQAVEELTSALNRRGAELHSARQIPTGEAAVQATQRRITAFIKDSDELEARREFNNWFVSSGVVLVIDMKNGTALFGRGNVQIERRKKTLLSLSQAEEDAALFGFTDSAIQQIGKQIAELYAYENELSKIHRHGKEKSRRTRVAETVRFLEERDYRSWKAGKLQSDWPQPDKADKHCDLSLLKHIVKARIARAKAAASQSKRPKSLSQQQMQQQQ